MSPSTPWPGPWWRCSAACCGGARGGGGGGWWFVSPGAPRRSGPVVEDLHDGVAYLAARLGVPIVPVGIGGSEEILARGRKVPKLGRVVLVVGDPLEPPSRDGAVRR